MCWQAGVVYAGEWKHNEMAGWGTLRVPRKYVYKGQFKKNERHGYGRCEWWDGQFYEGMWKDGKMHGPGKYGTLRVSAIWNWNDGQMGTLLHKLPSSTVGGPIQLVVLEAPKRVPELQASYKHVSALLKRYHVHTESSRTETQQQLMAVGSPTSHHRSMSPRGMEPRSATDSHYSSHRGPKPRQMKLLNASNLHGVRDAHSMSPSHRAVIRAAVEGRGDGGALYSTRTSDDSFLESGRMSTGRPTLSDHYARHVDATREESPRFQAALSPADGEDSMRKTQTKELKPPKLDSDAARQGATSAASQQGADMPPETQNSGIRDKNRMPDPPQLIQFLPLERYEQNHPLDCIHNNAFVKFDLDLECEIDFPQWGFRVGNPFIWQGSKMKDCLIITEIYGGAEEGPLRVWNLEQCGGDEGVGIARNLVAAGAARGTRSNQLPRMSPTKSGPPQWPIKKFARIVSVNGVTKDLVRMLKLLSMATRDLKLGVVNSAFVKAYEGGSEKLTDGTAPALPYAPNEVRPTTAGSGRTGRSGRSGGGQLALTDGTGTTGIATAAGGVPAGGGLSDAAKELALSSRPGRGGRPTSRERAGPRGGGGRRSSRPRDESGGGKSSARKRDKAPEATGGGEEV
mmetsp:Transcript_17283/g.42962  ORF Transcript_17283/g.42962 Transcript_17283/m.42962 type:complete len:627 (+) Transcript_17283:1114-2994(+)|eukprot:CAMPEP_0178997476 /NCGR_PEP_ID=MMETSP0795-20121207/8947_1 /TAXON_ID=88552 /ORGANISM="Amoebophrya sp., Strain Ameob2" /LENGTH=626 /DNA_ID=CAMNT_0020689985 /DNA_START=332 /DNA_END=2212 /DNA_ORIENTATION=+